MAVLHFLYSLFSSNYVTPTLSFTCLNCSSTFIEDANLMEDAIVLYFVMNLILIRTWIFCCNFLSWIYHFGPRQLSFRRIFQQVYACIDDNRGTMDVQVVILKMYKKILWNKSARRVFILLILYYKKNNDNYLALDYEEELAKCELEQNYELPDVITNDSERFRAPECISVPNDNYVKLLYEDELIKSETSFELEQNYEVPDGQFKPNFLGLDLYVNIVTSGGTTMYNGISERVEEEMKSLLAGIYRCVREVLGLFIALTEAILYVFIGMCGNWHTLDLVDGILIIIKFWILVLLLDEVLQKGCGMDSGISLFIEINIYTKAILYH
eukprot:135655_1